MPGLHPRGLAPSAEFEAVHRILGRSPYTCQAIRCLRGERSHTPVSSLFRHLAFWGHYKTGAWATRGCQNLILKQISDSSWFHLHTILVDFHTFPTLLISLYSHLQPISGILGGSSTRVTSLEFQTGPTQSGGHLFRAVNNRVKKGQATRICPPC